MRNHTGTRITIFAASICCALSLDLCSAYGGLIIQSRYPYQMSKLPLAQATSINVEAYVKNYFQTPLMLKGIHEQPTAMMPIDLPGIFTNPSAPLPVAPINPPEEVIPTQGE